MSQKVGRKRDSNKKMVRSRVENEMELARLEKVVLGKKESFIDAVGNSASTLSEITKEDVNEPNYVKTEKVAAWVDEDDLNLAIPRKLKKYSTGKSDNYSDLLKRQFHKNVGYPTWANKTNASRMSADDEDDDELMRCGKLLGKQRTLPKDILRVNKLPDLNMETRSEGQLINAVEFHPSATVALVAGSSGTASIIQIGKSANSKLQTIKFRNFPIDCARFSADGREFIVGSKRSRSFFYYDMMEGRSVQIPMHHNIGPLNVSKFRTSPDGKFIAICGLFGTIHLLSAKTKEWICDLKMNTGISDIAFSRDGTFMYSYGNNGEIYVWDMTNRCCTRKMFDEGCIKGLSMAFSSNGQILAAGSSSGIVNLYETPFSEVNMVPAKVIKNLVTPITNLAFNSSSEILAIASNEKKDALRLVHFPSMTVFSNFPNLHDVGKPRVASFSPSSGYFAIGNCKQTVLLYRLRHYKNY